MSFMRNKGKKASGLAGKNKRKEKEQPKAGRVKVPKLLEGDITSDSEDDRDEMRDSDSDHEMETANEKRTRLAKEMLEKIKEKVTDEHELVSSYLKNELMEKSGRVFHAIADEFLPTPAEDLKFGHWGRLKAVTCLVVTNDNRLIFSASKDGAVVKWSLPECVKVGVIKKGENPKKVDRKNPKKVDRKNPVVRKSHFGAVNALAVSSDNKYLASGGEDHVVNVWEVESLEHVHQFTGHRDAVMSLSFQQGARTLYSGSKDRSIKLWNLNEMAYMETLWGHEDHVTSLDTLSQERVVSGGGRDGSVRLWKIPEESHLIFQASGCIDNVSYVDNKHFISSSNENSIFLWSTDKKKPLFTIKNVHNNNNNNHNNNNNKDFNSRNEDDNNDSNLINSRNTKNQTKNELLQKTKRDSNSLTNGTIEVIVNNNTETFNETKNHTHTDNETNTQTDNETNTHNETKNHTHRDNETNTQTDNHITDHMEIDDMTKTITGINNKTDKNADTPNQTNKNADTSSHTDKNADTSSHTDKNADTSSHTDTYADILSKTSKCTPFTSQSEQCEQWISSLRALKHTNLFASGSRDGVVRFWKIDSNFKSVQALFQVPLRGFINDLRFSEDGSFLVVAVAQEHRMGRWFKTDKTVKNGICSIPLRRKPKNQDTKALFL